MLKKYSWFGELMSWIRYSMNSQWGPTNYKVAFLFWIECNFTIVLTPLWDNDDFLFPCVHSFYLRKIETIDTISSNFYTPKNAVKSFHTQNILPSQNRKKKSNEIQHKKNKRVQPFINFFLTHIQKQRWFIISIPKCGNIEKIKY